MTKTVYENVQPILKGFRSSFTLKFTQGMWDAYLMNTQDIAVTFNDTLDDSTPLWVGTTTNSGIVRNNTDRTLTINIPETATQNWDMNYIKFDLMRYSGSTKVAIPGVWTWPVSKRVGINVPV